MDIIYSNINLPLFSTKQSKNIENGVNKYTTKMILSNIIDDTAITRFNKQTFKKNPSMQFENTSNNFCGVISSPVIVCKNNTTKSKSSLNIDDYTTENQTNSCKNIEIDEVFIKSDCSKNVPKKTINKKQKNISFSNEKLWEINRVNQILHNKITNGAKPTYSRIKPPISLVRATSTINRERKNKDIIKENEILAKKLKNVRSTIFK
ncbi:PREDICTED: uncharacterized protein LOC107172974 [Diuraphis noxia]|uniref:uncharacterized protein LOC107172974 n=1 Tax=Diuraphis noxia TaxID=143948 RepID=UPI00076366D1|nr:PREDICTED: uncharacterized protein LOC107172974 [Diuraphis noxia]